ncbi:MAG: hypothetical protein ACTH7L_03945 [Psychrobacter alimentarius]
MKDNDRKSERNSSADNVDEYLRTLGNENAREQRYYSQEQPFSADEMTRLVNEDRLNELLAQSDAFLSSLNDEIKDFDDEC